MAFTINDLRIKHEEEGHTRAIERRATADICWNLEKRGWVRAGPFTPEVALMRPDDTPKQQPDFSSLPGISPGARPVATYA